MTEQVLKHRVVVDLGPGRAVLELDGAGFAALNLTDVAGGDFAPTEQSTTLIDQGTDVSDAIGEDYEGVSRPQGAAFDIGPHEMAR